MLQASTQDSTVARIERIKSEIDSDLIRAGCDAIASAAACLSMACELFKKAELTDEETKAGRAIDSSLYVVARSLQQAAFAGGSIVLETEKRQWIALAAAAE